MFDAVGGERLALPEGDFFAQGGADGFFLVGIAFGGDAEYAGIFRGVVPGVDVMDKAALFAQFFHEGAGATGADDGSEHVQRRGVGVR